MKQLDKYLQQLHESVRLTSEGNKWSDRFKAGLVGASLALGGEHALNHSDAHKAPSSSIQGVELAPNRSITVTINGDYPGESDAILNTLEDQLDQQHVAYQTSRNRVRITVPETTERLTSFLEDFLSDYPNVRLTR